VPVWLLQFACCSHWLTCDELMSEQVSAFWHIASMICVHSLCVLELLEEQCTSAASVRNSAILFMSHPLFIMKSVHSTMWLRSVDAAGVGCLAQPG
jgi:hypothetical protein